MKERIELLMEKLRSKVISEIELKELDEKLYKLIHGYWHEHIAGNRSQKAVDLLDSLEQEYLELKINFTIANL